MATTARHVYLDFTDPNPFLLSPRLLANVSTNRNKSPQLQPRTEILDLCEFTLKLELFSMPMWCSLCHRRLLGRKWRMHLQTRIHRPWLRHVRFWFLLLARKPKPKEGRIYYRVDHNQRRRFPVEFLFSDMVLVQKAFKRTASTFH